jgi:hypothetical protein
MDSISRTNEHSLLTSYYSTRTTYNIHANTSQLQQQQREQHPQNQQVPKLQVREAAAVSVVLCPSCLIELTHAFVSLLLLKNLELRPELLQLPEEEEEEEEEEDDDDDVTGSDGGRAAVKEELWIDRV